MVSKHMSKEEIREDRVVTAAVQTAEYVRKNARWVVAAAVVMIVALVVAILVAQGRDRSERAAATEYLQAQNYYFSGDYAQAAAQFQALADRRGSTQAARQARLFQANSELAMGNAAGAEEVYRKFLSSPASSDPILKASGHRGLGACLASQEKLPEAAAEYKKAASIEENPLGGDDLLQAALIQKKAGDIQGAIQSLNMILTDHPRSSAVNEARIRLQEFLALR